eukprot:m.53106 g.53106  ORF g.53106 m.53106 type:complete len:157 (+) comp10841_c0_seq2:148-618(+)
MAAKDERERPTPIAEDYNWRTSIVKEEQLRSQWPEKYGHMATAYQDLQCAQKDLMATRTSFGTGSHPKMTEYGLNFGSNDNVRVDPVKQAAASPKTSNLHMTSNGSYGAHLNETGKNNDTQSSLQSLNPLELSGTARVARAKQDVEKRFGWPLGCV